MVSSNETPHIQPSTMDPPLEQENSDHLSSLAHLNEPPTPIRDKLRLRRVDSMDVESNRVSSLAHHGSQVLTRSLILQLAYQSIGVVYGDVGTSPLYVFSSTFPNGINEQKDVLGAMSIIFYTLTLIPLIKYVFIVLYANDNGDGGTFALYSLICRHAKVSFSQNQQVEDHDVSTYKFQAPSTKLERAMKVREALENSQAAKTGLLILALLGTSLVIGDGVLTPCISVLSAVSGIQQATPSLKQEHVVIISIVILILLFVVQRFGTSKVGFIFAPAVLVWFTFIGIIGLYNIIKHDPGVLKAFNPAYMYDYFQRNKKDGWVSLGGTVLAITGTEAMFADVGHFSVSSIQISFSLVVYPCLLLAYFGQGAYLMKYPNDVAASFYKSTPSPVYWPMFAVAVVASIIASQAMISATFTVVKQSMSLGCFPRVKVVHTSSKVAGQVYIPEINYLLMIACVIVTGAFQTTTQIGNAYGIAVVGVMVVTTSLIGLIMIMIWQTRLIFVIGFLLLFGSVELLYFSSVLYKFDQGGYLPLAFAAVLLFVMYVWHYVSTKRYFYEVDNKVSQEALGDILPRAHRVPGVALVYTELVHGIPSLFAHMVDNLPALHSLVVLVSVKVLPVSTVLNEERFLVRRVGPKNYHMYRCVARYGYKDLFEENEDFERQLFASLANFISYELAEGGVKFRVNSSNANSQQEEDTLEIDEIENQVADKNEESTTGITQKTKLLSRSRSSHDSNRHSGRISPTSSSIVPIGEGADKVMHSGRLSIGSISAHHVEISRQLSRRSSKKLMNEGATQGELKFLKDAKDAGIVYLLGHSDVKASSNSPLMKQFIVDYAYQFLRRNCRSGRDALIVPQQKMLEVGMIYYI